MNNKLILGFNIVLLAAVIVLFVLFFQHKAATKTVLVQNDGMTSPSELSKAQPHPQNYRIAYFEADSIYENYTYYREVRKALITRENQIQAQLAKKKSTFVAMAKEYQEKGPTLSQTEQMNYQKELSQMRDDYNNLDQQLGQQFQEEQNRRILDVKSKIQQFLKVYAREKGYYFVFSTGSSDADNIYYKDTARDITRDLLQGLNQKK